MHACSCHCRLSFRGQPRRCCVCLPRVLLFPPLPSRLRYLVHKHIEELPHLTTFSVGERESRRVVVCYADLRYFTCFTSCCPLRGVPVLYYLVPRLVPQQRQFWVVFVFQRCVSVFFFSAGMIIMTTWEMQTQRATASGMNLLRVRRGNTRKRLLPSRKHQSKHVTEDPRGRTNPSTCREQCERDCRYRTHHNPPKTRL